MKINTKSIGFALLICGGTALLWPRLSGWPQRQDGVLFAQERPQRPGPQEEGRDFEERGPRPERGSFGPGGPGPQQDLEIVKQFDRDGDKILNREERLSARKWLSEQGAGGRGGFGRGRAGFCPPDGAGPPGGFGPPGGGERVAGTPGPRVQLEEVPTFPEGPLYSQKVVRTLFLTFEHDDWEEELALFKNTDVEVPATLMVDGTTYPEIGVSFRGMSSFMMVPTGSKRSLKLSLDFQQPQQKLYGYKTLNLLNSNGDPSMMSAALYSRLVRERIPAPQVNFVKVVINGESWGLYANAQQFNKDFLQENYREAEGARWKASGNPGADAGLRYLGENISEYKQRFEIKSKDKTDSWKALINLCRVLDKTPPAKLEEKLAPILDIDEVLWFLSYDVALVGIPVTTLAAYLFRPRNITLPQQTLERTLNIRIGLGRDVKAVLEPTFRAHLERWDLNSIATAKQGAALNLCYHARLLNSDVAIPLTVELNQLEGVQEVELRC